MNTQGLPAAARAARKDLGLTQAQVAEAAEMSLGAYQGFETGKTMLQPENLKSMLRVLKLTSDETALAQATRDEWPRDVQVFLDAMGAYLVTLDDERRLDVIHDLFKMIFGSR